MAETSERSANPWPFLLPFALFMIGNLWSIDVMGSFEGDGFEGSVIPEMTPEVWQYIAKLGIQTVACGSALIYFHKYYLRQFPLKISPLAIVVGILGFVLWVGVCFPQIENNLLSRLPEWLVGNLDRPSFDPFKIKVGWILALFLFSRFVVLAVIVPLVEELFVRGWLVRWVHNLDWSNVGYKGLSVAALLSASIYGVAAHPKEMIAAFLWFGLVTWLMVKTQNIWDCVIAHSVTNLLLGIYVLCYSQWHLW